MIVIRGIVTNRMLRGRRKKRKKNNVFIFVLNFLSFLLTESVSVVLSVFRWPARRGKNITVTRTLLYKQISCFKL